MGTARIFFPLYLPFRTRTMRRAHFSFSGGRRRAIISVWFGFRARLCGARGGKEGVLHESLLVNGSPHAHGCTYTALCEVKQTLEANGVAARLLHIGTQPVAGCIACGRCARTGRCVFDDKVNEVLETLDEYSAIVLGSPVYYASASGQVCAFADRLFYAGGRRFAGKLGACVVSCRRGGASAAFDRLNKYFTIANMPVVPSQYWNQVHGRTPEEVRRDEEGLQTMRTLGQNMAWLLHCIEAGQKAGVRPPVYEPPVATNFIR